jgi:hypothetical protein
MPVMGAVWVDLSQGSFEIGPPSVKGGRETPFFEGSLARTVEGLNDCTYATLICFLRME